jgi:hypothetical protein
MPVFECCPSGACPPDPRDISAAILNLNPEQRHLWRLVAALWLYLRLRPARRARGEASRTFRRDADPSGDPAPAGSDLPAALPAGSAETTGADEAAKDDTEADRGPPSV